MARPSGCVVSSSFATAQISSETPVPGPGGEGGGPGGDGGGGDPHPPEPEPPTGRGAVNNNPKAYYGKFTLDSVRAIRQVEEILLNVVEHLQSTEDGSVDLTFEINATSSGFDDRIKRVVRENAN